MNSQKPKFGDKKIKKIDRCRYWLLIFEDEEYFRRFWFAKRDFSLVFRKMGLVDNSICQELPDIPSRFFKLHHYIVIVICQKKNSERWMFENFNNCMMRIFPLQNNHSLTYLYGKYGYSKYFRKYPCQKIEKQIPMNPSHQNVNNERKAEEICYKLVSLFQELARCFEDNNLEKINIFQNINLPNGLQETKQAEEKIDERVEEEIMANEEEERMANEEKERMVYEEKERMANEEKERLANEEKERMANEEKERLANEEKERLANEEKERLANEEKERMANEEKERRANEEKERMANEEKERLANEEKERMANEEKERIENEEKERMANEEKERLANEEKERMANEEKERIENEEKERMANEEKERHANLLEVREKHTKMNKAKNKDETSKANRNTQKRKITNDVLTTPKKSESRTAKIYGLRTAPLASTLYPRGVYYIPPFK